jgi:hypothetical protein
MLKSEELSNILDKVTESINLAQQIYNGEEKNIELVQNNGYVVLAMLPEDDTTIVCTNYVYQYKIQDNDEPEQIIRGLIDSIYKKDITPRRHEIKKLKKQLNQQLERVYKWESKLHSMKKNSEIYDLEQRETYLNKLSEINESIYIKYKKLNTIKTDLYEYDLFKNILYSAIKELAA